MKNAQLRRRCSNLRGASISDVKIANIQAWLLIPTLVIFATTCSGGIKFPSFAGNNPVPKKAIVGQDTDIEEEYKTEWRSRAEKYRLDLYSSIEKLRDLGTGDQFIRIHSELFLAYSWRFFPSFCKISWATAKE